jgi:hypothetical protein
LQLTIRLKIKEYPSTADGSGKVQLVTDDIVNFVTFRSFLRLLKTEQKNWATQKIEGVIERLQPKVAGRLLSLRAVNENFQNRDKNFRDDSEKILDESGMRGM